MPKQNRHSETTINRQAPVTCYFFAKEPEAPAANGRAAVSNALSASEVIRQRISGVVGGNATAMRTAAAATNADTSVSITRSSVVDDMYTLTMQLPEDAESHEAMLRQVTEILNDQGLVAAWGAEQRLSTPSVGPSEGTSPLPIPGGGEGTSPIPIPGGGGRALAATQYNDNRFVFNNVLLEELQESKGKPAPSQREVHVFLIDNLPRYDLASTGVNTGNERILSLVMDVLRNKLTFVPTAKVLAKDLAVETPEIADISSHGLFAAEIIRNVAPDADITIVEGLNSDGKGYLTWLFESITVLVNKILEIRKVSPNAVFIVNIALYCDINPVVEQYYRDLMGYDIDKLAGDIASRFAALLPQNNAEALPWIRIFAAAGNEGKDGKHPAPELPAALEHFLEVAALDESGEELAAYSNRLGRKPREGIRAFGGPMSGIFIDPFYGTGINATPNRFGYAQWSGTSFATAITSAVVARLATEGYTLDDAVKLVRANPDLLMPKNS
jgi:hypothetical protein